MLQESMLDNPEATRQRLVRYFVKRGMIKYTDPIVRPYEFM